MDPGNAAVGFPRPRFARLLSLCAALLFAVAGCSSLSDLGPSAASDEPPDAAAKAAPSPLQQGDEARAHGDFARAAELYRTAHAADPKALEPMLRLGASLVAMQAYPEALSAYQEAATIAPRDPEATWRLGELLLIRDKPEDALAQIQIALAARQSDPRIYNAIGVAYGMLGQYDLARRNFTAGLRIAPDHLGLRDNLGLTQFLMGDYDGAVATLSDLAQLPQAARARQNLAMIYALHGEIDKARAMGRRDLDEASVEANIAYCRSLASLDKETLAQEGVTIFGIQFSGDPGIKQVPRIAARPAAPSQSQ